MQSGSQLQSTPSKNRVSSLSQAGNTNTKVDGIHSAVLADVEEAEYCQFDSILKYFLSLCLEPEQKKKLDTLQDEIEDAEAKATPEDNPSNIDPELERKISEREEILNAAYNRCLDAAYEVANNQSIKSDLEALYHSLNLPEKARYDPFVKLCNNALELLGNLKNIPLCPPSTLNIKFKKTDDTTIRTGKKGSSDTIRKPDCVCTSTHGLELLQENLRLWFPILLAAEFKRFSKTIKANSRAAAAIQKESKFERSPITPDIPTEGESLSVPSSKKRSRTDGASASSTKKAKLSQSREPASNREKDGKAQVARYALEMMSSSQGVHHVINMYITDENLTIWYYDRQGLIESAKIDLIADFPRVLVLLLALQRFSLEDWGIIPKLNPRAVQAHRAPESASTSSTLITLNQLTMSSTSGFVDSHLEKPGLTKIVMKSQLLLSNKPYCLSGRATAVLKSTGRVAGRVTRLACKISHPEVKRFNEGVTLRVVHKIAEVKDGDMQRHLPRLLFYGDLKGTGTRRIRSILGLKWQGDRVLRILAFERLDKITSLKGEKFIKAWLDTVTCHAFLWKYGVEHGDPSAYNSMYDPRNKCGVLADYDLAIYQWMERQPGTDRTGTVPFMALDLLHKRYWDGLIVRYYHHELEAFIWTLPFVFLLYTNQMRGSHAAVDLWITNDYTVCQEKKKGFYDDRELPTYKATKDFDKCWPFGMGLCDTLRDDHRQQEARRKQKPRGEPLPVPFHLETSKNMWDSVLETLVQQSDKYPLNEHVARLREQEPQFIEGTEHLADIRAIYEQITGGHIS